MLRRGITIIRRETEYKAAILYQALESHPLLKPFVAENGNRSKTVIVADCGEHTENLTRYLLEKGIQPGDGYGQFKRQHLRFANFPAHSKEQVELLVDLIGEFKK
jgi:phosphoserine aminotransferase